MAPLTMKPESQVCMRVLPIGLKQVVSGDGCRISLGNDKHGLKLGCGGGGVVVVAIACLARTKLWMHVPARHRAGVVAG